jgi:hypothetical protein
MRKKNNKTIKADPYDLQNLILEYLFFGTDSITLSEFDMVRYKNSSVNYLVPSPFESNNFQTGVRDWGRVLCMYFAFLQKAKKEVVEYYRKAKRGKIVVPKSKIASERYIRPVWDKYNHVSKKQAKGFFYIISPWVPGQSFSCEINGERVRFYLKAGFTQNPDERFDRINKGYNFTSINYKCLLLMVANTSFEKKFKKRFSSFRVPSDEAYADDFDGIIEGDEFYQGEFYFDSEEIFSFIEEHAHLDITQKLRIIVENINKKMNEIYRESNSELFIDIPHSLGLLEENKEEIEERIKKEEIENAEEKELPIIFNC